MTDIKKVEVILRESGSSQRKPQKQSEGLMEISQHVETFTNELFIRISEKLTDRKFIELLMIWVLPDTVTPPSSLRNRNSEITEVSLQILPSNHFWAFEGEVFSEI